MREANRRRGRAYLFSLLLLVVTLVAMLAYGKKICSLELLGSLLAYAFRWELRQIRPFSQHERYDLSIGSYPQLSSSRKAM